MPAPSQLDPKAIDALSEIGAQVRFNKPDRFGEVHNVYLVLDSGEEIHICAGGYDGEIAMTLEGQST